MKKKLISMLLVMAIVLPMMAAMMPAKAARLRASALSSRRDHFFSFISIPPQKLVYRKLLTPDMDRMLQRSSR